MLNRGLIHFRIEEGTLDIAVAQLLAHRRDWYSCLQELAGSTMAQLVNRGLDLGLLTIFLPGVVGHAVLQWQRTSPVARVATKDRARGNVALFEVTPQQAHTIRSGSEHDGAFALPFSEHADFLIVGAQVHIRGEQTERLSYANSCFVKERKKRAVTQV